MDHPIVMGTAGGEYMEAAVVVEWTRSPGDDVEAGDTIAVLETAKAGFEIEATHSGVIKEVLFKVGDEVPVGAVLGHISDKTAEAITPPRPERLSEAATEGTESGGTREDGAPAHLPETAPAVPRADRQAGRTVATPLARRVARERGVDLSALEGTGPGGRIKLRDVERASTTAGSRPEPRTETPAALAEASTAPEAPPRRDLLRETDGVPIVFIHGFGADRSAWRQVTPLLPPRQPTVLVELPGHGEAPGLPVRGIEDLAFAVADRLHGLGIREAHLVGHSLGGAAALSLTQHGPLTVRSLCLIAPAGFGPEIDAAFLRGFVEATRPESLEPWLARMVADPRSLPPRFANALLRERERTGTGQPQRDIAAALFPDGTQAIRLTDALSRVAVPTKLIWGLADAIIPAKHAFGAPGTVALHLLRDVGHVPHLEAPAIVARLIDELVRSRA